MVIDRSEHVTFLHSGPVGSQKEGVEHQTLVFSDGEHVGSTQQTKRGVSFRTNWRTTPQRTDCAIR